MEVSLADISRDVGVSLPESWDELLKK